MIEKNIKWLVFLFGFLLYANTIAFDYALDDKIVIVNNEFTKKGFAGIFDLVSNDSMVGFFGRKKNLVSGGRYRPLALVTHAVEWKIFGKNPHVSHAINAILYGLTSVVLLLLLQLIFNENKPTLFSISVLSTLVFTAHPLHTEVVANIKSRDELLSILFALMAFFGVLKYYLDNQFKWLIIGAVCFGLSLFSKESSVSFIGIIPITIYFFQKFNFKRVAISLAPLLLVTIVYLWVRHLVIGGFNTNIPDELMNNPFVSATTSEKYGSILITFLLYYKLLFFPHPLSHDYYPKQIPLVDFTEPLPLLSLAITLSLLVFALVSLKSKNKWSYLVWLFFGGFALYTNVLFPIGTFMNERFMYLSSLSMAIGLAFFIQFLWKKTSKKIGAAVLGVVLVAFSAKTIARNFDWKNDHTLALADVKTSRNSAKVNMSAGLAMLEKAKETENKNEKNKYLNEAFQYLQTSLKIYPTYIQPMLLLGNTYSEAESYSEAIAMYKNVLNINSEYNHAIQNLEYVGDKNTQLGNYTLAAQAYEVLLQYQPTLIRVYGKIGEVYGKHLNNLPKAEAYLQTAHQQAPQNTDIIQKLGVVLALQGKVQQALEVFLIGEKAEPENARILMNIGLTYNNLGQSGLAQQYLNKAFSLDPTLNKN